MKKKPRIAAIFMAFMITLNLCPAVVFAAEQDRVTPDCPICGHIHDEACGYRKAVEGQPCAHIHENACYERRLVCALEEADAHTHTEDCFSKQLVCVDGSTEHIHSENCYEVGVVCGLEESEGHIHAQACYKSVAVCPHALGEHDENCGYVEAVESGSCQHTCAEPQAEAVGSVYSVGDAVSFSAALASIEAAAEKDATIEVTSDIALSEPFTGVEGKAITVRGQGVPTPMLTWPNGADTVRLTGPVTFENIRISPKTIYANGQALVLGTGFGGGKDGQQRMIVYGGSDIDLAADTSVIVRDGVYKLIAGGNSAGTLTGDTYVEFGGNAKFPTAADGYEEGDAKLPENSEHYNLYFDSVVEESGGPVLEFIVKLGYLPYGIYGGGIGGNVDGTTNVKVIGGEVFQVFGGGAVRTPPSATNGNLGQVSANTNVEITGGTVKSIYGGGYNDIYACDEEGEAKEEYRNTRAAVGGTANVTIAGDAHIPDARRVQWNTTSGHDIPAVYGGSFHSSVGNTNVVIGGNAILESVVGDDGYGMVFAGGCNDKVFGTTYVELTGNARIGNDQNGEIGIGAPNGGIITPLGRSNSSRCYLGGVDYAYGAEIMNQGQADYAATAKVSGGETDILMAAHKQDPNVEKETKVHGPVQLVQSGGTLQSIEAGCRNGQKVKIDGNVDVVLSGGTTTKYILGKFLSNGNAIAGTVNLTFNTCGTETDYLVVPNLINFNAITVKNGAYVAVYPQYVQYGLQKAPFTMVDDLSVAQGGYLALRDNGSIDGDLVIDGALHLGMGLLQPKTLTAAGTGTGTGEIRTIAVPQSGTNYSVAKTPRVGNECVYAKDTGSTMVLGLTNPEENLGVGRKNKKSGQDVWYVVAQTPPQNITVTYSWKGGDRPASIPTDVTLPAQKAIEKGTAFTAEMPDTKQNFLFDGWYLDEGYTQKFTDGTKLNNDTTLYGNWRIGKDEILWYRNIYIQNADGTYSDQPSSHGQGGWAAPNARVSISASDFEGEIIAEEILGTDVVYDANYEGNRLAADTALQAGKHDPLRIYYKRAPHTVTYKYEGEVPAGAPQLPAKVNTWYGATVTVAPPLYLEGYVFSGWEVEFPENAAIADGKLTMPNADVVLVGTWSKMPQPTDPPVDPEEPKPGAPTPPPSSPSDPDKTNPQTGDTANLGLYLALLLVSLVGLSALLVIWVKRERRGRR